LWNEDAWALILMLRSRPRRERRGELSAARSPLRGRRRLLAGGIRRAWSGRASATRAGAGCPTSPESGRGREHASQGRIGSGNVRW